MNLSDHDKQEIIRRLEVGEPLPERFRFLLFDDKREVELVWNGKSAEVCNAVLPFQTIEHVDEPRAEKTEDLPLTGDLFAVDSRGRQLQGWTDKLIWGDNKLILSSLKSGAWREEIERQGGIKLIYIDPPFDVGADFSMDIEVGDATFTKKPNILEEIAYRDTWGKGADSFIAMIYERLILMRDLLAEDGSIYVHCDWRLNSYIRLVLDEVFGKENFRNEITWEKIKSVKAQAAGFGNVKDSIYFYANNIKFNQQRVAHKEDYVRSMYRHTDENGRRYRLHDFTQTGQGEPRDFGEPWGVLAPPIGKHWIWSQEKITAGIKRGEIVFSKNGIPSVKRYLDEVKGQAVSDIWTDINPIGSISKERNNYPTQKPEALLERIIKASSNEGDLVADFFCGSGTTAAVAEKLGRKWICSDLGKFAIHTTRKRMIGVQRQLKADGKNYRAFEILNLGKYERQHYVGVNPDLREEQRQRQQEAKERTFVDLILRAYRAERVYNFAVFNGKKQGRLVVVGPVNLPVGRRFVEEIVHECRRKHVTKVDMLGFEFEMGLFPRALHEAREQGIDLVPKYIPAEVFDKRAVEKDQVVFHDVAFIEVKTHVKNSGNAGCKTVAVELTDFSVHYHQGMAENVAQKLRNKGRKVVVEKGQVVEISKDGNGRVSRKTLTEEWTDWVDYWSVDFDYQSRRELIRVQNDEGEWEEKWTGDYVFENEWQSFRTRRERSLELTSVAHECPPGRRKIAVKVVDIFGNDTMTIVEAKV